MRAETFYTRSNSLTEVDALNRVLDILKEVGASDQLMKSAESIRSIKIADKARADATKTQVAPVKKTVLEPTNTSEMPEKSKKIDLDQPRISEKSQVPVVESVPKSETSTSPSYVAGVGVAILAGVILGIYIFRRRE